MTKTDATGSKPLSLGFIGGALNSAVGYTHYVASRLDGKWLPVCGCFSKDAELNRAAAAEYGIENGRAYATWQELVKAESRRLDAVLIVTPTPAHFDIVQACLDAGIAVICEKALSLDSDEIRQIIENRDRQNGFLAVTYNYSGYPMVRELKNRIARGELGEIIHFQAEMPQEGFIRLLAEGGKPVPQAWRLADHKVPTIHLDLGVHLHQLIHYLTAKHPLEVISQQNSYGWFSEIIDNVSCLASYSEGVQGQFWFSKSALGHRNGLKLRIYGSKASAQWYQLNPEELVFSHADGRREIIDRASPVNIAAIPRYNRFKSGHPAGFIEAFANLYRDIARSLREFRANGKWQSEEVYSAELALEGLYFLEAMVDSTKTRSWQSIKNS